MWVDITKPTFIDILSYYPKCQQPLGESHTIASLGQGNKQTILQQMIPTRIAAGKSAAASQNYINIDFWTLCPKTTPSYAISNPKHISYYGLSFKVNITTWWRCWGQKVTH